MKMQNSIFIFLLYLVGYSIIAIKPLSASYREIPSSKNNLSSLIDQEKDLQKIIKQQERYELEPNLLQQLGEVQCLIGNIHMEGEGVEINFREAARWWCEASTYGNADAQYNLGIMYSQGHAGEVDDEKAFQYFLQAANQRHSDAQFNVGYMYEKGRGVSKDSGLALKYYEEAAKQENTDALINLNGMYREGRGTCKNQKKAIECLKKAAKLGEPAGYYNLGLLHRFGDAELSVPPNPKLAILFFLEAAEKGSDMAQFWLGHMYKRGEGCGQDDERALRWFKQSAENGNELAAAAIEKYQSEKDPRALKGIAYYGLGAQFEEGNIVKKNIQKAVEFYQEAAELGNAEALFALSKLHSNEKEGLLNKALAFKYCFEAANKGHSIAQHYLGILYRGGIGTRKDYDQSFVYFQKSALQGNIDAQFKLGLSYFHGDGVEQNPALAFKWLKEAAEQGHTESQFNLSLLYEIGKGIDKDVTQSLVWLHKSAQGGFIEAQYKLGSKFLEEKRSREDLDKAFLWFEKAANQGDLNAQYNLALMYDSGEGTRVNKKIAFELFKQAAMRGHVSAQYNLAGAYYQGEGTERNVEAAFKWYFRAAEQNDCDSQGMLGFMYKKGEGVIKSDIRAAEYSLKAAKQGCEVSCLAIADMHQHGEGVLKEPEQSIKYLKTIKDTNTVSRFLTDLKYRKNGKNFEDECALINRYVRYEGGALHLVFSPAKIIYNSTFSRMLLEEKDSLSSSVAKKYKKSASQGNICSQSRFALIHEYGLGVKKDTRKAIEWYLEAAQHGDIDAQRLLGISYENGLISFKSKDSFFLQYIQAEQVNLDTIPKWPLKMAHTWVHTGHSVLGQLYASGLIPCLPECSNKEIFSWLYAASLKGDARALYRLGRMYKYGWGIHKNKKRAVDYFMRAADRGYSLSQKALAEAYRYGKGISQSNMEALKWYVRTAKQKDAGATAAIKEMADEYYGPALYALGKAHEEGWGIAQDEDEAILQYEASARQEYFKAQYVITLKQLDGKTSPKENLEPLEVLTILSGEAARKNYLNFSGRRFDWKEKKKLKKLQEQRLCEEGYYRAQHKLAELYETGKVVPHTTIKEVMVSYTEAIKLYELAIKSNKPVAMVPLERVRVSLEKLNRMSGEKIVMEDCSEFNQFLKESAGEKPLSPEFFHQVAFFYTAANSLAKNESDKLKKIILFILTLPENSKQMQSVLSMLTNLMQSEEFKKTQEESEDCRLMSLSSLEKDVEIICRPWQFICLPSSLSGNINISETRIRDPLIEMFNSYFQHAESKYDPDLFKRSIDKTLNLFDQLKKEGHIKDQSLYSEDDSNYGTKETLEKLLTHNHKPNNRFGHRLIHIADIIYELFKKDPSLVASQLTQWAKRGLNCLTASEEEMNRFYLDYITNTKADSGALTKEDRTLEMQVALSLAKLRYQLLDKIVEERDNQRIHSVKYLEKKARYALGLVGDAENYTDESEFTVPPKYINMTPAQVFSKTLEHYTPVFMAQHIAKQIDNKAIDYDKIIRRLRFQYIREKVAPQGDLDNSLFRDENYFLDHCTDEEFKNHTFSLSLHNINRGIQNYSNWNVLKTESFQQAHQQIEEFYDENHKFTLNGATALLKGLGYLREDLN